jgi:hypothetical protein
MEPYEELLADPSDGRARHLSFGLRDMSVPDSTATMTATLGMEEGGLNKNTMSISVHPSRLPALERRGLLVRIKRGLYALPDHEQMDDRLEALLAIPDSVLCLGSSLSIHEIGTWEPPEIYLAVRAGRKVHVPEYPWQRHCHGGFARIYTPRQEKYSEAP